MLLKVNPINLIKTDNHKIKKNKNTQKTNEFSNLTTRNKVILGLSGLAILGAASVGISIKKGLSNVKNIKEINYFGQSIANHAVKSSGSRGEQAVKLYNARIAEKKADVLKYKMEHGMFYGKSKQAMEHIRNNLKNLELDAII